MRSDPRHDWLEHVPDPCVVTDAGDVVLAVNAAAIACFAGPVAGLPLGALLDDTGAGHGSWRTTGRRRNGVPFPVEIAAAAPGGAAGGRVLTCREIRAVATAEGVAALLDASFARAPIGMAFCNTDGDYVRVNPAMCALLGRAEPELVGRRDQEFTHPDDRASDVDAAWRILRGELDTWQTEKRFVRPDGTCVWVIANMTFVRDAQGSPLAWLGQFQDITSRRAMEEQLREQADEDPLTGLPNRRRLLHDLRHAVAASLRHGRPGAVLVLDLDGFKAINDAHGHARGDAVLVSVAHRLRARVRESDLLARLGGDEFAVVLDGAGPVEAERVACDLRSAVEHCPEAALGVSIGVATFGADATDTPEGLLDRADREMYRAKLAVRGAV